MPSTKDLDIKNEPLKILLYSENGSGKSIAAASFYKAGPIKFFDFDGRMEPVKAYYPDIDIQYDTYDSHNFRKFLEELEKLQDECKWKTIVLDSVTSASVSCVLYSLKVAGKFKIGGDNKLPITSWDEINRETVWFTEMLEACCKVIYKKFKTNIIWTCHPVPRVLVEDDKITRTTSMLAYGNKVPGIIPGYFNEIYNIQYEKTAVDKFRRIVNTMPKNNFPGKSARGLPASFDITDKIFYDELMKYINKA